MKAGFIKTIANKTKATKSTETQKLKEIKHKKEDNHKKRPIHQFRKKIGNSWKTTSLPEKTHSVCCYYDRSNLQVQVNAKNKKVSRDFSSKYKLNES